MKKTLIALSLFTSMSLMAATDGTAGATSSGQIDVRLNKGNEVRISNLQDVDFGGVNASPADKYIDVCIYSTTGSYDLTASSNYGTGNSFRMANGGATSFITYDLEWATTPSGTSGADLNNGVTSATYNNANTTQNDCGGSVNSRLFVEINAGSFNGASAGNYADTLTLVVSPQ